MKNFFLILISLFILTGVKGQTDSVINNRSNDLLKKHDKEPLRDPVYCCRKCNYTSAKPGTCPVDRTTLIKEGMYFCPIDGSTNGQPGKCPKCGRKMKKMEMPTHEG
jgi:rubrerythrin